MLATLACFNPFLGQLCSHTQSCWWIVARVILKKPPNFRHFWSTLTENALHKAITQVRKVRFQFGQNSDDLEPATINYRQKKNLVHSPFKEKQ